jgi:lysozyme
VSTFAIQDLIGDLNHDEGRRLMPYVDTVGKTSIGVGRNLTDVGISDAECDTLLQNDIEKTLAWLDANLPWWRHLDAVRQRAFNQRARLLGFTNTLAAIESADWQNAHDEMLDSLWAKQVGERATRLANMILTGESNAA